MKKYNRPLDLMAYAMTLAHEGKVRSSLKVFAAACAHSDATKAIDIIDASNAIAVQASRKPGMKVSASAKRRSTVTTRLRASTQLRANDIELDEDEEDIDLDADLDSELDDEDLGNDDTDDDGDDDLDDTELESLLDGDQSVEADVDEEEVDDVALFASTLNKLQGGNRRGRSRNRR